MDDRDSDYALESPSSPRTRTMSRSYSTLSITDTSPGAMMCGTGTSASTGSSRRPSGNGSTVPRRSSGLLLHEIHPPKRRLSSHQMLLLTPFGGMIPSGALAKEGEGSGMGMSRGEGSIGMGMASRAGSSSMGRCESSIMGRSPSSMDMGMGIPAPIPRQRHHSASQRLSTSSPLTSAPMMTIPSASEHSSSGSGGSRTQQGEDGVDDMIQVENVGSVVHMTRSNSLPVLTLRELDALKEKDGELGIARGGGWAWVSREEDVLEDDLEENDDTPLMTDSTASSLSIASSDPSSSAFTPTRQSFPFPFSDPFAPATNATSTMARDSPIPPFNTSLLPTSFHPSATSPGYHYSPMYNGSRRVSETPLPQLQKDEYSPRVGSPGTNAVDRRPSAPVRGSRGSFGGSDRRSSASGRVPRGSPFTNSRGHSPKTTRTPTISSPSKTPMLPSTDRRPSIPARPVLQRYRSSPNEHEGLQITLRNRDSEGGPSRRGSALPNDPTTTHKSRGQWAAVDVVEHLTPSPLASTASTSIAVFPPAPTFESDLLPTMRRVVLTGEERQIGRGRFESVDSAFPTRKKGEARLGGSLNVSISGGSGMGWDASEGNLRRGSLGVAVLDRRDRNEGRLRVVSAGHEGHWSDRRGSWAEGRVSH